MKVYTIHPPDARCLLLPMHREYAVCTSNVEYACSSTFICTHTSAVSTPNLLSNPGVIRNIREVFHGISFWLQVITCFVNTVNTGVMQPCKIYSYYKSPAHNWGKEKTRVRHNTETKFGPNNQTFGWKIWFRWQKNETLVWFFPHFTSSPHKTPTHRTQCKQKRRREI